MSALHASPTLHCVKCHAVYTAPNKCSLCFPCRHELLTAGEPPDDVHVVESIQSYFRSHFYEKDWPAFVPSLIKRERYLGEELDEHWRGCLIEWLTTPLGQAGTPVPPWHWTSDERPTRVILRFRLWQPLKEGFIEWHWYENDPRPVGLRLLTPAGLRRSGELAALIRARQPRGRPPNGTNWTSEQWKSQRQWAEDESHKEFRRPAQVSEVREWLSLNARTEHKYRELWGVPGAWK